MKDKEKAPSLGDDALVKCATEALEWARLEAQARREKELAREPLRAAAAAAFLASGGRVQTWGVGPALVVVRESYRALAEGQTLPPLVTETSWSVGSGADWARAQAIAGDRWPLICEALGVTTSTRPAKGAIAALLRAGDTDGAAVALECLADCQVRPRVEGGR